MTKVRIIPALFFSAFVLGCGDAQMPFPQAPAGGGDEKSGGEQATQITYQDIRPILDNRCMKCHNPGVLGADMNWGNEAVITRKADRVMARLSNRSMPPAGNELPDAERQKLIDWAKGEIEKSKGGGLARPKSAQPEAELAAPIEPVDVRVAFTQRCTQCHGVNGESIGPDIPNLAGHGKEYFVERVKYFMSPAAEGLMADQIKALVKEFNLPPKELQEAIEYAADHFGQKKVSQSLDAAEGLRKSQSTSEQTLYEKGKQLAQERACVSCHVDPTLSPLPVAPMIFLQKELVLKKRLTEFRSGKGGVMMPDIAKDLSDDDIAALAVYVGRTHPAEAR